MSRDLRMNPMDMTRTHLKKRAMKMSARDTRFSTTEPSCAEQCKWQMYGCTKSVEYIKRWWNGEFGYGR